MKTILPTIVLLLSMVSCSAQEQPPPTDRPVGGPCEGCEALYEYENSPLDAVDTLPGFETTEPKLKLLGTVFKPDGQTPAPDIILYIYHTNRAGIYETMGTETGWARQHGFIRGWVKTDAKGHYTFYTFRPAPYPNNQEPEHIHLTVKEPGTTAYYLDSFVFDDDPLLTDRERASLDNRGGSGIVHPTLEEGLFVARRDIVLGRNIPDYE